MDETIAIDAIADDDEPPRRFDNQHARATTSAARLGCIASILGAIIAVVGPALLNKYGGPFFRNKQGKRGRNGKRGVKSVVFEFQSESSQSSQPGLVELAGRHDLIPVKQEVWLTMRMTGSSKGRISGPIQLFRNGTWKHSCQCPIENVKLASTQGRAKTLTVTAVLIPKSEHDKVQALTGKDLSLEATLKKFGKSELLAETVTVLP